MFLYKYRHEPIKNYGTSHVKRKLSVLIERGYHDPLLMEQFQIHKVKDWDAISLDGSKIYASLTLPHVIKPYMSHNQAAHCAATNLSRKVVNPLRLLAFA